jgi:hypothetical protein
MGLITTYFLDGRSQKTFYEEKGKLSESGPIAAPGQVAQDPDMSRVFARMELSLNCMRKKIDQDIGFGDEPAETVRKLRNLVRGPCGADPDTVKALAEAEKEAGVAASQERERAAEQAAAKAQADSERSAMFSNFLGQVSSILGSYQVGQQMAAAEAAAATAATSRPPAQASTATSSNSNRVAEAPAREPSGRSRWVHNQTSASTTARISGNFTFRNGCNSTVEVFWCFPRAGGGCSGGGTWTVGAGRGWPVMDNEASIIWSACRGANGGGWDRDVAPGTRYTCHLLQW